MFSKNSVLFTNFRKIKTNIDNRKGHFPINKSLASYLFYRGTTAPPPVGQGLLIVEKSRSHSDTPHSVGLLWTSDRPDAQTST